MKAKLWKFNNHREIEINKAMNSHKGKYRLLWTILIASIVLVGCTIPGTQANPSATPQPTDTQVPATGAISGFIWEDKCANYEVSEALPAGCVVTNGDPKFVGNGILDTGESAIPAAQVLLGEGVCPAVGYATTTTGIDGKFSFSGLPAGVYCVTAQAPLQGLGVWTYPKVGAAEGVNYISIALKAGGIVTDVNFARDYFEARPSPTPLPTTTPTAVPCTDVATFIRDVTIPDGTRLDPGESFTKIWRIRNAGTCTWTSEYSMVLVSGSALQGSKVKTLPGPIAPEEVVDLSLDLQAPLERGSYEGFWQLRNAQGAVFGVGADANSTFWVLIKVGPEPEPKITEWRGAYYENRELKGDPVLIRNDKEIKFDWGLGSPDKNVPVENFSARWTRTLKYDEGLYRFHLSMDDGATLWVDDRLVVDEWKDGANREVTIDLALKKGDHAIKVEYYESGGNAKVRLWWEKLTNVSYSAWKGTYWFNDKMDSKWALVRSDNEIKFDWKEGSPAYGIPKDNFSALWERMVGFNAGVYRIYAKADDGIRIYLDNALVIDEWHLSDGTATYSVEANLSGEHKISVAYYENGGQAKVQVWWELVSVVNKPPVAKDDTFSVNEDGVLTVAGTGVLANDTDPEGSSMTVILETGPSHGNVVLNSDGSFTYSPNLDFNGTDAFTYKANDGKDNSNIATVTISVKPVNDVPVAEDDNALTNVDTPVIIDVLVNDIGLGDRPLTLVVKDLPTNGIAQVVDQKFHYTPNSGFIGVDSFTYTVTDVDGESSTAIVTISVTPPVVEP